MRFLFDENISHRILSLLPERHADSSHIKKEGLMNASDKEIWEYAKSNGYIIVTQDSDFNELNLLYGFPPKIIWIRTGNIKTNVLLELLIKYESDIQLFLNDENYGCFEVFRIYS